MPKKAIDAEETDASDGVKAAEVRGVVTVDVKAAVIEDGKAAVIVKVVATVIEDAKTATEMIDEDEDLTSRVI